MDRKERILIYINSKEYIPLKFDEMKTVLSVPKEDTEEFKTILDELTEEGRIFMSKRGRYTPVTDGNNCASGFLSCSARGYFGFLLNEDGEDVFIAGEDMASALNGDKVLVRIEKRNTEGKNEGRVIKILERANQTVVGVIYKEKNGYLCVRPDSRQIYAKINVAPCDAMNGEIGDRVLVNVTEYRNDGQIYGEIAEILGDENSLKSCVEGIILSHGIKQEFDAETLKEADRVPTTVTDIKGREDLRGKSIFTIDGDDARDFDDAVSVDILENGNYMLGVHIADVSEYVKEGSALDNEAYTRGTSVYLADRVIPMLPESLSNGICSLNPHVDRLTLSCFMEIDADGNVKDHRLAKTVIRSVERMTYNNVNKILDGDKELCERYSHIVDTLKTMETLAEILRAKRDRRGAIQFDFPESRVIVDENGEPVGIEREIRGTSNKMIEEFMLAANETVAEYAYWSEIPFIYRNHEPPETEKIKAFNALIMRFGLSIKGKFDEENPIKPKALQKVLDAVKGMDEERIIQTNMLQSLMKARYSADSTEHFGLAAKYYCHFTSPIRRYPDLVVHRILKCLIDGKLSDMPHFRHITAKAAKQSSERETEAEYTERDADDLMKTAYMSAFVGETFEGIVANVTGFGMFVELNNTVQGLVRLENMTDDYYEYDENTASLRGSRTGKTYAAGTDVNVVLAKCDILAHQIDFVLEGDEHLLKRFEKRVAKPKRKATKKKYRYKRKKK